MNFAEAINSKYNDIVYEHFERLYHRFPKKKLLSNGFPDILPIGYYKVVVNIRAEVDVVIVFTLKIKTELNWCMVYSIDHMQHISHFDFTIWK